MSCVSTWSHTIVVIPCSFQHQVRGYDAVEEHDPMERLKKLATGPAIKSLEDELKDVHSQVNIHDFDYKPVPRTEDEE